LPEKSAIEGESNGLRIRWPPVRRFLFPPAFATLPVPSTVASVALEVCRKA